LSNLLVNVQCDLFTGERGDLWEFLRLVVTANLVAWPLAYFAVNSLIQSSYAYKPGIGVSIYIFAGVITLAAALMAITYQTHKAATVNPVNALRYEQHIIRKKRIKKVISKTFS
jgi:hypothetical protein